MPRAIRFSSAFTLTGRMIIRTPPVSKFFRLRRAELHPRLTARWRRVHLACNPAVKWMHKDWRGKLAAAIGVGIENYRALGKKQPPMLVADYRKQIKSAPIEPAIQEGKLKEADSSLLDLVGRSAFLAPQHASTPSQRSSLESAPIVP